MRTNWIKTVEKILGTLALTDRIENPAGLKTKAKTTVHSKYTEYWRKTLGEETSNRLYLL